eukprot:comp13032_c0_seq1/m.17606 comp13032_c0_seq1/g.17606  ORF comp13032_c0_seq1/g.17606 comp13032_c0_seq1/m.17606 type:complete len:205 (-) comp13032_c0_seq1:132-746(-)
MGNTESKKIFHALDKGDVAGAEELLDQAADWAKVRGPHGITVLMAAADRGLEEFAEWILAHPKANASVASHTELMDDRGKTAVVHAVEHQQLEIVKMICRDMNKRVLDQTCPDYDGLSPLHHAVILGNAEMVAYLLSSEGHCHPSSESRKKWTPMHYAAQIGRADIIKLILKAKGRADVVNNDGKTPRDLAIEHGYTECADMLD